MLHLGCTSVGYRSGRGDPAEAKHGAASSGWHDKRGEYIGHGYRGGYTQGSVGYICSVGVADLIVSLV
jgi:hypothetical protein